LYAEFKDRLLARAKRATVGDPLDPATEVGPLVNESQFDEVMAAIERACQEGAALVAGGHRVGDTGFLVAPTIFEGVADDAYLSCEEVFGPVAALYSFETLDEALARANAVCFGLSAAIFTSSLNAAARFEREAAAGILHVNSQTAGADVHVPFGGIKESGFGPHEQGESALDFYSDLVTVYVDV
jgi:alpha-ketoglutaric semialdehyde dehydrogenase